MALPSAVCRGLPGSGYRPRLLRYASTAPAASPRNIRR